jgi:hypothetical protein
MSYKGRIKQMEEMHRLLDKQINEMQINHPHVDEQHVTELKKKKLQIKDEISRLNRMQWEEDHERVGYDDR